jgi:hypothetical protein
MELRADNCHEQIAATVQLVISNGLYLLEQQKYSNSLIQEILGLSQNQIL